MHSILIPHGYSAGRAREEEKRADAVKQKHVQTLEYLKFQKKKKVIQVRLSPFIFQIV